MLEHLLERGYEFLLFTLPEMLDFYYYGVFVCICSIIFSTKTVGVIFSFKKTVQCEVHLLDDYV